MDLVSCSLWAEIEKLYGRRNRIWSILKTQIRRSYGLNEVCPALILCLKDLSDGFFVLFLLKFRIRLSQVDIQMTTEKYFTSKTTYCHWWLQSDQNPSLYCDYDNFENLSYLYWHTLVFITKLDYSNSVFLSEFCHLHA